MLISAYANAFISACLLDDHPPELRAYCRYLPPIYACAGLSAGLLKQLTSLKSKSAGICRYIKDYEIAARFRIKHRRASASGELAVW